MCIRDIAEVRPRLERAVADIPGRPTSPQEQFDLTEQLAIQILDSEHDLHPAGHLRELLMSYLYIRQIELGLLPDIDPREE